MKNTNCILLSSILNSYPVLGHFEEDYYNYAHLLKHKCKLDPPKVTWYEGSQRYRRVPEERGFCVSRA